MVIQRVHLINVLVAINQHLLLQRVINQLKYYRNDKAKGNDRVQSLIINECVDQDDQQEVNIVELAELGEKDDWQVGT